MLVQLPYCLCTATHHFVVYYLYSATGLLLKYLKPERSILGIFTQISGMITECYKYLISVHLLGSEGIDIVSII